MSLILGIDVGGSSTKIIGLYEDGSIQSMLRVHAEDPLTSLYGALGNYLSTNHLALSDLRHIALTGMGTTAVQGNLYGVPTVHVDEFSAIGAGGLHLAKRESAIVVSLGTGTAFIWAEQDGTARHLGGSGIGGGTLAGLCSCLVGAQEFRQIRKLAADGDLSKVDLLIQDMTDTSITTLPPHMTAANFAKLAEDATPADLTLGAINLVLQSIGTMCVFACGSCHTNTVVLTGALTTLAQAKDNFALFHQLYGIDFLLPEHATFATSIGAALCSVRK